AVRRHARRHAQRRERARRRLDLHARAPRRAAAAAPGAAAPDAPHVPAALAPAEDALVTEHDRSAAGGSSGGPPGARGEQLPKVLLVEDNVHNRRIFQGVLVHAGFDVVEAEDGEHAMALARELRPDLILMDL